MIISCTNGEITAEEKKAVEEYALSHYPGRAERVDVTVNGEWLDLKTTLRSQPFSRIRRITGYLVGDMGRWNNAKRAEEKERVKHGVTE